MENMENIEMKDTETEEKENSGAGKTYTEEEIQEMLQREGDRRVTEALKKAEKKNAAKLKEAEKLAAMNEQEKYEYQLEQRETAIAEKEKQLALAENKNEASKILAEKGISLSLVDFVVAEDAETMNSNIQLLDKAFKASVKAEVEKRLASNSPKKNFVDGSSTTKADLLKMPISQLNEMIKNNPELKQVLIGG